MKGAQTRCCTATAIVQGGTDVVNIVALQGQAQQVPGERPSLLILMRASPVDAVLKTLLKVLS